MLWSWSSSTNMQH